MLCIQDLKLSYNAIELVKSISISFLPGSITYLKGKNGSGKTTLLQTLAGLKSINSGEIKLFGVNLVDFYKPYCIYLGHNLGLETEMKVIDQIEFWALSYNSPQMIPAAIEFWDLEEILETKISLLSAGQQKRVALSRLTCCHSNLWLLDEPETNLDENNIKFLQHAIISKSQAGGIILLSSHSDNRIKNSQLINISDYN